jgi:hypothetical protein
MNLSKHPPSEKSQQTLEIMKQAVAKALEKKKRLGQYAVFWEDGRPVLIGEDAPQMLSGQETKIS